MEEKILEILHNQEKITIEELISKLNITSNEDILSLEQLLNELEEKAILYHSDKKKTYLLFENSHLKKGRLSVNQKGFGFVAAGLANDVYIDKKDLRDAMDGDVVVIEITKKTPGREAGKVIKVIKREVRNLIGEFTLLKNGDGLVLIDDKKLNLSIRIKKQNTMNAVTGSKVKVKLLREKTKFKKDYFGIITDIIGHKDDPFVDIISVAYKYGFTHKFNEAVEKQLSEIPNEVTSEDLVGRTDLRNEMIFTIDGDDTKDIDDAISISKLKNGNYKLGVHIADVSHYVKEGTPLDNEAYERGTSVYLASSVLPMLPHQLSNGICSLNQDVDRLTISCDMEIDNKGNVVDYSIYPSVIKSRIKMTYKKVNMILNDNIIPEGYEPYVETLKLMEELSKILRKFKVNRGYIEFNSSEAKIITDETGKVVDIQKRIQSTGENLIEDFMIAANETVATHIYNMDLPFLYRVHESAKEDKVSLFMHFLSLNGIVMTGKKNNLHPKEIADLLNNLRDQESFPILSQLLLECMTKAYYSKDNIGHFGLASRCYTHFTSPIRRYCDTTVHRLLHTYLFDGNINKSTEEYWNKKLEVIATHISEQEVNSVDCEREVDDMKMAEYMENHIGEEYEGIISKTVPFGMFVELDNLVDGLVKIKDMADDYYTFKEELFSIVGQKTGKIYRTGDKIKIIVVKASKELRQIDFEIKED